VQSQRIIAMVYGEPPAGQARRSVRLIATEAVKRKLAPRVGRETASRNTHQGCVILADMHNFFVSAKSTRKKPQITIVGKTATYSELP
jgi:hypothetical protein